MSWSLTIKWWSHCPCDQCLCERVRRDLWGFNDAFVQILGDFCKKFGHCTTSKYFSNVKSPLTMKNFVQMYAPQCTIKLQCRKMLMLHRQMFAQSMNILSDSIWYHKIFAQSLHDIAWSACISSRHISGTSAGTRNVSGRYQHVYWEILPAATINTCTHVAFLEKSPSRQKAAPTSQIIPVYRPEYVWQHGKMKRISWYIQIHWSPIAIISRIKYNVWEFKACQLVFQDIPRYLLLLQIETSTKLAAQQLQFSSSAGSSDLCWCICWCMILTAVLSTCRHKILPMTLPYDTRDWRCCMKHRCGKMNCWLIHKKTNIRSSLRDPNMQCQG